MRVLISGAGIAGPALAFWLHRAGADVTVVERAPEPRPGGHAVDVRGVARGVIEKMGAREAIRTKQIDDRGFALVDARGRRMAALPADMFGGEGIVAEIEIARGDLARILYDATANTVTYRFGDRIVDIGEEVTFAGGRKDRFDVVVGADGVRSGVRKIAFGPHADYVRPLGGYASYFTVQDPGDLDNWSAMFNAPGGRAVLVRPEAGGTAKASLSFRTKEVYDRLTRDEQIRLLTERFTGVGWRVPTLLAQLPAAKDLYFDEVSQVRVDKWARGRVVLVGDAGYCGSPLGGMGTSMSLVGAYVLAGEMSGSKSPEQAFAAYQEQMADYVAEGTQLPPGGIAMSAPNGRLAIRARALSMSMMNHWPMKQMLAKQFGKAEAITLRDYPGLAQDDEPVQHDSRALDLHPYRVRTAGGPGA
ncbi:2-polyprenyl-6-methoxyphenol hydroxylase-like FAD-dependent oxidoreductase [Actinoplanes tereljensis]|uniref:FAD-dependent oxidoreductase n=1 Tax=Paractinoplanes tereljensis TaxID=571912 RepID=A0A919NHK6_9ACTN|nr:FAD-dependent monooxygenase [Actinoplanes tereljensis]GIF17922.1 FAD-dependent oxidoreductase [Actinoplanes tereljensis]